MEVDQISRALDQCASRHVLTVLRGLTYWNSYYIASLTGMDGSVAGSTRRVGATSRWQFSAAAFTPRPHHAALTNFPCPRSCLASIATGRCLRAYSPSQSLPSASVGHPSMLLHAAAPSIDLRGYSLHRVRALSQNRLPLPRATLYHSFTSATPRISSG